MAKAVCPGCRYPVDLGRYIEVGEYVSCPRCEADLEVISLHPLTLDSADEQQENRRASWSMPASTKWSKRDKRERRKAYAERFGDFD